MKRKIVVVFSGGIDSTVTLATYLAMGAEVAAISFDYGQRHTRELRSAETIARTLGVVHEIVDLSELARLFNRNALTGGAPVPHGHYTDDSMMKTVVPNRNMLMATIAASWAIKLDASAIALGVHAGDHTIYPDCRPAFIDFLASAIQMGNWTRIGVLTPFINSSKTEIVRLGKALNAPLALTWSCYEGNSLHCGQCGTCVERKEAFQLAGVEDPTEYAP